MTPRVCCIAIFNIHILYLYLLAAKVIAWRARQAQASKRVTSRWWQVSIALVGTLPSSFFIFHFSHFSIILLMMALYRAILLIAFCLVLSPISLCKAFSNPTPNRQPSTISSLQLKTNNIIERDDDVSTSRRSFFISTAATLAGSSLFHPLEANAVTDCFKDCVKNCKLIAPKVSKKFVHMICAHYVSFVIRHLYIASA